MTKLKLGPIADDKPVKVTLELPAGLHRDLTTYAEVLARESGQPASSPVRLIAPMLERFMAADRAFAKVRRSKKGDDSISANLYRPFPWNRRLAGLIHQSVEEFVLSDPKLESLLSLE